MEKIKKITGILKTIAESYPPGSSEAKAIKEAATAYIWLNQHKTLKRKYEAYLRISNKPLSKAELKHLHSMGIKA